jgi:hypothetical protein
MRRSASEAIRSLEERLSRLEKQSSFLDFFTGKISLREIESLIKKKHRSADVDIKRGKINLSFELNSRTYWFEGHFVQSGDKVKVSSLSNILLFKKLKNRSPKMRSLNDPRLLVIEFRPDFNKMGIKPTDIGSLNIYIDTREKLILRSDFGEPLLFRNFMKNLRKALVTSYT